MRRPTPASGPLPAHPPSEFARYEARNAALYDRAETHDCVITGERAELHAESMHLESVYLDGFRIPSARIARLSVRATRWTDTDISNAEMSRSGWHDSLITRSRLTGVNFGEATLREVTVDRCKADMANFRFARLRYVTFVDCVLRNADFSDAHLSHVRFKDCDLSGALFMHVRSDDTDVRGCQLEGIGGVSDLRGVTISSDQLAEISLQLAANVGLIVDDSANEVTTRAAP